MTSKLQQKNSMQQQDISTDLKDYLNALGRWPYSSVMVTTEHPYEDRKASEDDLQIPIW